MKLPNYENAVVPESKITKCLLARTHREGRNKARVFTALGFTPSDWDALARALLRHASEHEVAKTEDSPFGTRYTVEGAMASPASSTPFVRAVWFIETGDTVPKFVTAYPRERKRP